MNAGLATAVTSCPDPPVEIVLAHTRSIWHRRSLLPCLLGQRIGFSGKTTKGRGRFADFYSVPVLRGSGNVAILLLPRDRQLLSRRRRGRPDLLAGRLDRDHRCLGGRALRNVRYAAARWRPAFGQDLPQGCPAGATECGSRSAYEAGSPDPSQSLQRVNRLDCIAAGSGRLPARLNGRLRGRIAGALRGVGDEARLSLDADRLHGLGELAGRVPEVVMAGRRRGVEDCAVQAPDNGIVGAAPEEPACEARLVERGAAHPRRHGLLQAGQGAVVVLRLGLPAMRSWKRCERALGESQDAVCRALPAYGRTGRGLCGLVARGPAPEPHVILPPLILPTHQHHSCFRSIVLEQTVIIYNAELRLRARSTHRSHLAKPYIGFPFRCSPDPG